MTAYVLSYEGVSSYEGGEEIVGIFSSPEEAMKHGSRIHAFDVVTVRLFDGTRVLAAWKRRRRYVDGKVIISDWEETDRPDQPCVYYGEPEGR